MADYLPFNSILDGNGNPDRAVKAEDWAWYFSTFIGNGVFPKPTDGLQVVANDGMGILVKTGYGFIKGYAFRNPADYNIQVGTADGSLGRIDRVILRWDLTNRLMELDIKQGKPSASPVAPTLVRTEDTYELALADISVVAGTTTITQSAITDLRTNTDLCGIVEGTVSQIDWSVLTAQLNAFMSEYSDKVISDYGDYTAQIEAFESEYETNISEWTEGQQADFVAWVQTIQDILDDSTAGHLQNEIDGLKNGVDGLQDEINDTNEDVFNNLYGLCKKTTSISTNDDGNKVIIESDAGNLVTATTIISKSVNGDTLIITDVVPERGDFKYLKTVTISATDGGKQITEDYTKEEK